MKKTLIATLCFVALMIAVSLLADEAKTDERKVEVQLFIDVDDVRVDTRLNKIFDEKTEVSIEDESETFLYLDYIDEEGFLVQEIHVEGKRVVTIKRRDLD